MSKEAEESYTGDEETASSAPRTSTVSSSSSRSSEGESMDREQADVDGTGGGGGSSSNSHSTESSSIKGNHADGKQELPEEKHIEGGAVSDKKAAGVATSNEREEGKSTSDDENEDETAAGRKIHGATRTMGEQENVVDSSSGSSTSSKTTVPSSPLQHRQHTKGIRDRKSENEPQKRKEGTEEGDERASEKEHNGSSSGNEAKSPRRMDDSSTSSSSNRSSTVTPTVPPSDSLSDISCTPPAARSRSSLVSPSSGGENGSRSATTGVSATVAASENSPRDYLHQKDGLLLRSSEGSGTGGDGTTTTADDDEKQELSCKSAASGSPDRNGPTSLKPTNVGEDVKGIRHDDAQGSDLWSFFRWRTTEADTASNAAKGEPGSADAGPASSSNTGSSSADGEGSTSSGATLEPPAASTGGLSDAAAAAAKGLAAFFGGGSENEEALRRLSSGRASLVDEVGGIALGAADTEGNGAPRSPVVRFRGVNSTGDDVGGGDTTEGKSIMGKDDALEQQTTGQKKRTHDSARYGLNSVANMGFVDLVESLLLNHDTSGRMYHRGDGPMSSSSFPTSGLPSEGDSETESLSSLSESGIRSPSPNHLKGRQRRIRRGLLRRRGRGGTNAGEDEEGDDEEVEGDDEDDDEEDDDEDNYRWMVEDVEKYADEIHASMAKCLEREAHHTEAALKKSAVTLNDAVEIPEEKRMIGMEARLAALDLTLLDNVADAAVKMVDTGALLGLTLSNYATAAAGGAGGRRRWDDVAGNRSALQQMQAELSRLGSTSSEETSEDEASERTTRDATPRMAAVRTDSPSSSSSNASAPLPSDANSAAAGEEGRTTAGAVQKDKQEDVQKVSDVPATATDALNSTSLSSKCSRELFRG